MGSRHLTLKNNQNPKTTIEVSYHDCPAQGITFIINSQDKSGTNIYHEIFCIYDEDIYKLKNFIDEYIKQVDEEEKELQEVWQKAREQRIEKKLE